MKLDPEIRRRAILGLAIVGGLYVTARAMRWTGPDARLDLDHELLITGIIVITLWGVARVLGRTS